MKKLTALLLVVMMLATLCVATASAAPAKKQEKAVTSIVKGANALIDLTVKIAQITPKDDGAIAKKATDIIAAATKTVAFFIGGKVDCTYTDTEIDGTVYAIDPLIVINPVPLPPPPVIKKD